MKKFLALSPYVLALFAFCASAQNAKLVDGVAAHVNSHTITIAEVMREIPPGLFRDLPAAEREARYREVYDATLNAMIDSRLILDEAKGGGAQIAAWAIDSRVQEIVDRSFKGDRALLTAELAKEGKTFEEWRKELEDDMTIQYMRYHNIERVLAVPPKSIRAFYADNTAEFLSVERVDVSMIIFEAVEEDALQKLGALITERLGEGISFVDIAQTLSTRQAQEVGNISFNNMGLVVPAEDLKEELAEALAKIKDGGHTPLLVVDEVGYVLKRNATEPPRQVPLEEAWPFVENRLRDQLARERYAAWVGTLRKKSYVKPFELPRN